MSNRNLLSAILFSAFAMITSLVPLPASAQDQSINNQFFQPQVPQPQGFCGYCHILTYPKVINKSYETWQKGKHNKVGCVECHYTTFSSVAPSQLSEPATMEKSAHIPETPPLYFSHVALGGETINNIPQISDAGCMTAACHGKPEDPFRTKKIKFTEKVPFVHEPHLLKKNQIEGMQVNCTTCHQHETDMRHFQVLEATCHLCHFGNSKFNEGRARCELCHELPLKPVQKEEDPDKKPITHQMLKEAKVSCNSCHLDLLQGSVETKVTPYYEGQVIKTALFIGQRLKDENCLNCHDRTEYLKKARDKKEMHERHVNVKNARCFDCHRPILHRNTKIHQPMPDDCRACHTEPHRFQSLLVSGAGREDIPNMPDPMFNARTNCLGCHLEKGRTTRGQIVMKASSKTCIQCHTQDYEKMFDLWKRELDREIKKAQMLEKEAMVALAKQGASMTQDKLNDANQWLKAGRENLEIVQFGNGIHNSKYAMAILDRAELSFRDAVALLEGKDMSSTAVQEE